MRSVNHLFMVMPDDDTPTHDRIAADPKYAAFFGDCAGALDGTMVPAAISAEDAAMGSFRDRKKNISQNVLGVVNFDMTFQYILAGWEGSAHDGRVLRDASFTSDMAFVMGVVTVVFPKRVTRVPLGFVDLVPVVTGPEQPPALPPPAAAILSDGRDRLLPGGLNTSSSPSAAKRPSSIAAMVSGTGPRLSPPKPYP
jgi:hypothetical protein